MAYDEVLATRLRDAFAAEPSIVEKKMFGGLAFMRRGHMCVGIVGSELLARVGPDRHADALARPNVREMDFTGKPMRGFVFVTGDGLVDDGSLEDWVALCRAFNDGLAPK